MRLAPPDQPQPQLPLAPLIGVVFIILLFFVAAYAANTTERQLGLRLPAAANAADLTRTWRDLLINLTDQGDIIHEFRVLSPENFERRLKILVACARDAKGEAGLIIRADSRCPHGKVMQIIDRCRQLGITRIFFSVKASGEAEHVP